MPIRPLSKELQEKATREINELPDRIQDDIQHIREWVSKQPHLNIRDDDQWILNFLRGCKFSLERTKEKLDIYYTTRTIMPDFFHDEHLFTPEVRSYFENRVVCRLPKSADALSPVRYFTRSKHLNPENLRIVDALSGAFMLLDILIAKEDSLVVNGIEIIIDYEDFNYAFAPQLTPTLFKKLIMILQDAYPIRIKGVYFLNLPPFLHVLAELFVSFLSPKLQKRYHLYSKNNADNFYNAIPRSVLPDEYGGSAGKFDELSDNLRIFMENEKEWLLENCKYKSDETKRIGKTKCFSDLFNVDGAFRKLEVD